MNTRDYDYIELRLVAPAPEVTAVIERLARLGKVSEAEELRSALRDFTDRCRAVRRSLWDERGT